MDFFERSGNLINSINYGTGENSTSDDWYAFVLYIRRKFPHITQALTTNGSLHYVLKDSYEKRQIVRSSIDEVDVSLDWGDEQKHNYYRGNSFAFHWAIETLRYCKRNNIKTTIVMLGTDETLTPQNMSMIFEIAEKYDALLRINLYRPVNQISLMKPASFQSIVDIFDWIHDHHNIISISDPLFSSIFSSSFTKIDPSAKTSFRITSNGDIYPSTYLLYKELLIGNIADFTFEPKVLDNKTAQLFANFIVPEECKGCSVLNRCRGGVLDRRYIWYNNILERDPYCPKRYGQKANLRNYKIDNQNFSSVHDDYLPTLFFKC
jgi:radical SAM protein with 4Fe4S-binding SPASM domain